MKQVTAIFDIGKTNKKFFLFDANYQEVWREYTNIKEIIDEDGYPTEDLPGLSHWLKDLFDRILASEEYDITAINFSTYGASMVYLDEHDQLLTPLYNYTKPLPKKILEKFKQTYVQDGSFEVATGTPLTPTMLTAGLQLYWLKYEQTEVFKKVKYALSFPQYLSFLFTGIAVSEYTSIGCHTGLWNYETKDYHQWVYQEQLTHILPPIVSAQTSINMTYQTKRMRIGVGIHDSSAAMLPYLLSDKKPFILLSTGTWSIALNPFNDQPLTKNDLANNCLNYMQVNGERVKAARFFMGNEYKIQVEKISHYFKKPYGYHRDIVFNQDIYERLIQQKASRFKFETIVLKRDSPGQTSLEHFESFEEAYHQLMIELIELQTFALKNVIQKSTIKKIYIDGGFTDNYIFITLVTYHFSAYKVRTTISSLGSALGAAMVMSDDKLPKKFLKKNYKMQKLVPIELVSA
ncbi:hypothetical protein GCM10009117_24880 [Gangjinia marincola]|uniref:Carbohydrate kinase n=1 Tax=Gangjinia marincola TaxID=578463 RepID=A0ABP3XVL4_9FLAO